MSASHGHTPCYNFVLVYAFQLGQMTYETVYHVSTSVTFCLTFQTNLDPAKQHKARRVSVSKVLSVCVVCL